MSAEKEAQSVLMNFITLLPFSVLSVSSVVHDLMVQDLEAGANGSAQGIADVRIVGDRLDQRHVAGGH